MSLDLLGDDFDLHGGGQDLAFPHHENERAQALADGRRFARTWVHNGFVEVEGTKMSKSLGNVSNLIDLVEQYDPRCYRLLVLRSHYRSPIDVTDDTLRDAEAALARLDAFARRVAGAGLPAAEPDERRARPLPGRHGRRPADARGDRPASSTSSGGPTWRSTPATPRPRPRWPRRPPTSPGRSGLELRGDAAGAVPDEVLGWAAERDAARAGEGLGSRPTRSATASPPRATSSRTRPRARWSARPDPVGRRVERDYVRRTGRPA